jgi:FkbH-like protein
MDKIKLVIWDLDETFWSGTLSEEGIRYRPENHEAVIELSRRGIVNSICSKNDLASVRKVLVEQGIWEYFVFPKIDWNPKGEKIARMLEAMGLRAANALFIDDNPQNLEEAQFYNPGIQVASPAMLPGLLDDAALRGKADADLSRLKQYQLLEKKVDDRQQFTSSNDDFLRQCGIRVEICQDCLAVFERLLEMIERTNQLNFTKARIDALGLRSLLADASCRCEYVTVQDRYGNYGIAGFFALRAGRLEQFLFSCRILNMGVERWVYNELGRPELNIVGEVSDDPLALPVPDWINVRRAAGHSQNQAATKTVTWPRVLLKGGCDLEQVIDFLGRKSGAIVGEFNYMTRGGVPAHVEHFEIMRRAGSDVSQRYPDIYSRLPFLDEKSYETKFLSDDFDVYSYSPLINMSNGLYRHAATDWVIPYGDFNQDITDEANWNGLRISKQEISRDFLEWFKRHFTFEGPLSEAAFRDHLHWLCRRIAPHKQLILLTGAEIDMEHPCEYGRGQHHRRMNAVLEQVVREYDHVDLCDVRKFVRSTSDVSDNIRHYRRGAYYQIACELGDLIARRWTPGANRAVDRLHGSLTYAWLAGCDALRATVNRFRRVVR